MVTAQQKSNPFIELSTRICTELELLRSHDVKYTIRDTILIAII